MYTKTTFNQQDSTSSDDIINDLKEQIRLKTEELNKCTTRKNSLADVIVQNYNRLKNTDFTNSCSG